MIAVPMASSSRLPKEFLPKLSAALAGDGPALMPVPSAAPPAAQPEPFWAIEPPRLGPGDDDPADPTALVVATSGSTGRPRYVALSASALLASASATHDRLGGPGRWLLALPPAHVAGLQVLVRSLVARTPPTVLDPAGFTAPGFATAARTHLEGGASGGRSYLSLVPTQLSRIVQDAGEALDLLAGFDAVLVGGAALAPQLLSRARAAGVRVVATYGMTETCGGCVYDGRPLDGVRLRIEGRGPDGVGGPDAVGRVLLSGPVLARGYLGEPELTQIAEPDDAATGTGFVVDGDGVRWLRSSDLGSLDSAGLRFHGRTDDVIVTGGRKVAPSAVEQVLVELPAVAEVVVVGVDDEEWGQRVLAAVVPADPSDPPSLTTLREAVSASLGAAAAPRQLLVLERLPLRGPGKPDRAAVTALAQGAAAQPGAPAQPGTGTEPGAGTERQTAIEQRTEVD